jgi:isoleucyl-tRNA synthetase
MLEIDQWALARTSRLIQKCRKSYEDYQFHQAYSALYNFCTVDMSAFYLDILKDRLYTFATHSHARRSAQTALWHILDAINRLMAPILPFTAEEVHDAMYEGGGPIRDAESIHMLLFPCYISEHDRADLLADWEKLIGIRETVSKALEEVRKTGAIGNSLDAKVRLKAGGETAQLLRRHAQDLRYIFIVSQVVLEGEADFDAPLQVQVAAADGRKCERCWNYSALTGADAAFPSLCERCAPVVRPMAEKENR